MVCQQARCAPPWGQSLLRFAAGVPEIWARRGLSTRNAFAMMVASGVPTRVASWALFLSPGIYKDTAVTVTGLGTKLHSCLRSRTRSYYGSGRSCMVPANARLAWRGLEQPELQSSVAVSATRIFSPTGPLPTPMRSSLRLDKHYIAPGGLAERSAAIARSFSVTGSTPAPSAELHQELLNLNNDTVEAETLGGSANMTPTSPFPSKTSTRGGGTPGVCSVVWRRHALK